MMDHMFIQPAVLFVDILPLWDIRRQSNVQIDPVSNQFQRNRRSLLPDIFQLSLNFDEIETKNATIRDTGMYNREISTAATCSEMMSDVVRVPACFRCAPKKRIFTGKDIKRGMHLRFGRYFHYPNVNKYIHDNFQNTLKINGKEMFLYYHHVIVTEVYDQNDEFANVELIEFGGFPLKAVKSKINIYPLREHTEYINYKFQKYSIEEIIRRSRACLNSRFKFYQNYSVIYNNCEHLAMWCVAGEYFSFQVDEAVENIVGPLNTIIKRLLSLLEHVHDEILHKCIALTVVILILSTDFVYSMLQMCQFDRELKNGLICTNCHSSKKNNARFRQNCNASAIAYFVLKIFEGGCILDIMKKFCMVVSFLPFTYVLARTVVLYIQSKIENFHDHNISKVRIIRKTQLQIGSVIELPNFSKVIVKHINYVADSNEYVKMKIVHYPYRGILGTRVVSEEKFSFDLYKDWLQVLEFPIDMVYSSEQVVLNARQKLGETGFNTFTNRSSHMAWNCKVRTRNNKNLKAEFKDITKNEDVKEGDLVNFSYCCMPHKGIVTSKCKKAEILRFQFIHVHKDGIVQQSEAEIDFAKTNIYLCRFDQFNIHTNEQILEKANLKIGEKLSTTTFLKECLLI